LSTLSIFIKQTTYLATLPKRSGKLHNSTMVSINAPTRIGHATAMPGDVVLGRNSGRIFIPPQLAEQVVKGCL
jgi:regulator of RNase E activity RraA